MTIAYLLFFGINPEWSEREKTLWNVALTGEIFIHGSLVFRWIFVSLFR